MTIEKKQLTLELALFSRIRSKLHFLVLRGLTCRQIESFKILRSQEKTQIKRISASQFMKWPSVGRNGMQQGILNSFQSGFCNLRLINRTNVRMVRWDSYRTKWWMRKYFDLELILSGFHLRFVCHDFFLQMSGFFYEIAFYEILTVLSGFLYMVSQVSF